MSVSYQKTIKNDLKLKLEVKVSTYLSKYGNKFSLYRKIQNLIYSNLLKINLLLFKKLLAHGLAYIGTSVFNQPVTQKRTTLKPKKDPNRTLPTL